MDEQSANNENLYLYLVRRNSENKSWTRVNMGMLPHNGKKKIFVFVPKNQNVSVLTDRVCSELENIIGKEKWDNYEIYAPDWASDNIENESTALIAQLLIDKCLAQEVAKKSKQGNLMKLEVDEACQNLRNLLFIFYGNSFNMAMQIDKNLHILLEELTYLPIEIAFIQRQLLFVGYNCTDSEIGRYIPYCLVLFRILQSNKNLHLNTLWSDSFLAYLQKVQMEDDCVAYMHISKTQRALVIAKAVEGSYSGFLDDYFSDEKSEIGKFEENLYGAIIREILTNNAEFKNIEQFVRQASKTNPAIRDDFISALSLGKELSRDFYVYVNELRKKNKLGKNSLENSRTDYFDNLEDDVILLADEKYGTLLDYAYSFGNAELFSLVWKRFKNLISDDMYKETSDDKYVNRCLNYKNIIQVQKNLLQKSADEHKTEMFKILYDHNIDLTSLNLENTNGDILTFVADKYTE